MIFTELRFLLFLFAVFAVYWSLRDNTARKLWLLAMSFFFYAAWDWRFLSLIVISILVDYFVGLGLSRIDSRSRSSKDRHEAVKRRLLMLASLVANLGMLGFFKYFGFFVDSAQRLGRVLGFELGTPTLEIVLPVGISFFTFQTLSYSIDIYRRKLTATHNLLDLSLFVAFFPQLVAGPIVRAASFLPQLRQRASFAAVRFPPHLVLFLVGFAKKACISDNIAPSVDAYFASPESYTAQSAWIAILLYAIQIYCDFSGYSDMAIATAGMLGYDLGPNFRQPYLATNLREFWQRWHISLSTWLRDYLYIPLGGNRGGELRSHRNLMITMLLGGLWHGAAWHFVLWGAMHGTALSIHRLWRRRQESESTPSRTRFEVLLPAPLRTPLSTLVTLYFVCFAWVFFRAQSLDAALEIARSFVFFHSPGDARLHPAWWLLVVLFAGAHVASTRWLHLERFQKAPRWAFAPAYGVAVALVLLFVQTDVQPFIYFQF